MIGNILIWYTIYIDQILSNGTPNCMDEAKIMLTIKNQLLDKYKKLLTELNFSVNDMLNSLFIWVIGL